MVGVHVRNVFDAPRDAATSNDTLGAAAQAAAAAQYGSEAAEQLRAYRTASHWSAFVPRMQQLIAEAEGGGQPAGAGAEPRAPLRFYLAADSAEAYEQLGRSFGARIVRAPRQCSGSRCDYRDCESMLEAMADLLNLARCRRILGSGWSSYTEVAARWGGGADGGADEGGAGAGWLFGSSSSDGSEGVPVERAGVDFGEVPGLAAAAASSVRQCVCLEPGDPRPRRNGYVCVGAAELADAAESRAATAKAWAMAAAEQAAEWCPLKQACAANSTWPDRGTAQRPCGVWDLLAARWVYNPRRRPARGAAEDNEADDEGGFEYIQSLKNSLLSSIGYGTPPPPPSPPPPPPRRRPRSPITYDRQRATAVSTLMRRLREEIS
eukprot:Transcript_4161.p2 GENE.Transcript_4161~~Transcript_4161.p2  ORF type:complete len:379 (+),score=133.66 Transcript_4161:416-1552(+)